MRILITDGNERATLAAARSLIKSGHDVCVTAPSRPSLAGVSRGVRPRRVTSDPLTDPSQYAAELGRVAGQESIELLLPMTDASVEAVLEHRAVLPDSMIVPGPGLATYRAASDKARILELAGACGFDVPETRIINAPAECDAAVRESTYPAVVKPHRSVVMTGKARRKLGVTTVTDAAACRRALAALPASAFPVLLQRHVAGVGEGLFALRWGDRTVALFAHRRLREKPPEGGVSVYRESILLREQLVRPGLRLLQALDWHGVAMIECKRDAAGRYVIMEVNGRFWGSLQLAVDAGVDFPTLLVRCAAGESVPLCHDYRVGVRSRWFWGDLDHFLIRFRNGNGDRWKAAREGVKALARRERGEVWRWSDPLPSAVETLQWLGVLTRGTSGARSRNTAVPTGSVPDSVVP